jgi:asparagine synthase (glutamine-hydrolysing)
MCGITGWVSFQRDLRGERAVLEKMTRTVAHRGPDGAGTWLDRHAALGHRRLAVIDIAGGAQPMTVDTPDGTVALTYSGETYNFIELRAELSRHGHVFRTSSDTEVVLQGYLRWGAGLAEQLNGMYAFAVWDGRVQCLLLMRDRMGVKPLYYYPTEDGLLFGSEPKTILANPLAQPVVEADGLRELWARTKTPGHAFWAGMREVLPATVLTCDRSGLREHTYWTLPTLKHRDSLPSTIEHVRYLVDDIVRRQSIADVPQCMLLSGGLDSSALTAFAAGHFAERGERVRTVSVDLVGQAGDFQPDELRSTPDAPFIDEMVADVGSQHMNLVLKHDDLTDVEVRRVTVEAWDMPVGLGDLTTSLYLLFAATRDHATVALSGESADELFGGYRWFHDPVAQRVDTFPWYPMLSDAMSTSMVDEELLSLLDIDTYIADQYADAIAAVPDEVTGDEHEQRMRRILYLHLTRFVQLMLDRKDRMSMAVGLEVRVPFCDHRLIEYVYNTPWAMKIFDGREKSLLRAATRQLLPQSVLNRVKSPYPTIHDSRYVASLQEQVADLVRTNHRVMDFFSRARVRQAVLQPPAFIRMDQRVGLEKIVDMAIWLDVRAPVLKLS